MRRKLNFERPSPALVISLVALAIAATGTAIGAKKTKGLPGKNTVFSSDVKNNQLKSKDLKNGKGVKRVDLAADQQTQWALVSGAGNILRQSGGISVANKATPGWYYLNFRQNLSGRAIVVSSKFQAKATGGGTDLANGFASAALCGGVLSDASEGIPCDAPGTNTPNHVFVQTAEADVPDATGIGKSPMPFYITVVPR